MPKKKIAIGKIGLFSFPDGFESKKDCSIWQMIYHVLKQECKESDPYLADDYRSAIENVEIDSFVHLFELHETGSLELIDRERQIISTEQFYAEVLVKNVDLYMSVEHASKHFETLIDSRREVLEVFEQAKLVHDLLVLQINKAARNEGPSLLRIKEKELSRLSIQREYCCQIGKGCLKGWSAILQNNSAELVGGFLKRSHGKQRIDLIDNPKKVIGLLSHLLAKICPESTGFIGGDAPNFAKISRFLRKNIIREKVGTTQGEDGQFHQIREDFPEKRKIEELLSDGRYLLTDSVELTDRVRLPKSGSYVELEAPLSWPEKSK